MSGRRKRCAANGFRSLFFRFGHFSVTFSDLSGTESRIANRTIPGIAGLESREIPQREAKNEPNRSKAESRKIDSERHPNRVLSKLKAILESHASESLDSRFRIADSVPLSFWRFCHLFFSNKTKGLGEEAAPEIIHKLRLRKWPISSADFSWPLWKEQSTGLAFFGRQILGQYLAAPSSPGPFVLGCGFFAYSWKLPAYSGTFLLTVDNFIFLTYSWSFLAYNVSFFAYNWSFFAYNGKVRLILALRDCKQRSLTVSKKAPTVSKKASLFVLPLIFARPLVGISAPKKIFSPPPPHRHSPSALAPPTPPPRKTPPLPLLF